MTAKIIDGRKISKEMLSDISKELQLLKEKHDASPNIVTIKIGSDPSELYMRLRDKACNDVGIVSRHAEFSEDVSEKEVLESIAKLNKDKDVHGVLIQYPVPNHISSYTLMGAVSPKKDVEGFNPQNLGKTLIGDEDIIPCTPLAVLKILEYEKTDLKGKDVVIVNHSNVVGKPLSVLLLNRNASVSICHVFSKDIQRYTSNAEILITATGKAKLITKDHVKNDAFVIDVGISKTENGICGDADFDDVKEKAGKITPVPGGVGPVTIACSLLNMLKTFKNCLDEEKQDSK